MKELIKAALDIKAIKFSPEKPFQWASGYMMPIYNDNRLFLYHPDYRKLIVQGFMNIIEDNNLECDVVAGTATAGIPHAMALANTLDKPFIYIRNKAKDHGLNNLIEGAENLEDKRVLLVEDLISTGGSSINAVKAIRASRGNIEDCVAVFDYGFPEAKEAFSDIACRSYSIVDFESLIRTAKENCYLSTEQFHELERWSSNPFNWYSGDAKKKLCLALDGFTSREDILEAVKELSPYVGMYKIGNELFTRFGPRVVKDVQDAGGDVFLDLKFHDIPNTVRNASKAAAELGVYMFNIHSAGGTEMMEAAVEGVKEASVERKPKVIAVTMLTSLDDRAMKEVGYNSTLDENVVNLAKLSHTSGLDGVVCAAPDLESLREELPEGFMYVTPGIRGVSTAAGDDQKRVFSAREAVDAGSTVLVIGRAITQAEDRRKSAREILESIR